MVQWLGLQAASAGGMGLIPSWRTNISHTVQLGQKKNIYIYTYICIYVHTHFKKPNFVIRQRVIIR